MFSLYIDNNGNITWPIGNQRVQAANDMSEVSEHQPTAHVSHGFRTPGPAERHANTSLRSGHHRAVGLPVRPVPGQKPGRAARGHRVQPNVDLVPGLVRQPVQPVVHQHAELAVPQAGVVRPAALERGRLRCYLRVLSVRGRGGHGRWPRVLRQPSAARREPVAQRVHGVLEHALQLRSAQTDGDQFQGNRRHTPETAQTVARR